MIDNQNRLCQSHFSPKTDKHELFSPTDVGTPQRLVLVYFKVSTQEHFGCRYEARPKSCT